MKTYYQDEWVTIYHGDCREILLDITNCDLILTDPPYGIDYFSNYYVGFNPHRPIIGDDRYPAELIPWFKAIASKAVLLFCRWDCLLLPELPTPKSFIAMVKNNWTAGDLLHEYGRQWEGILFYPCGSHSFKARPSDVIDVRRVSPDKLLHPAQKPLKVCQALIEQNTEVGDTVLDPFLGSGTTALASKLLSRKCIGIEIEEKYCEIAANRCRQMVFKL